MAAQADGRYDEVLHGSPTDCPISNRIVSIEDEAQVLAVVSSWVENSMSTGQDSQPCPRDRIQIMNPADSYGFASRSLLKD
ncbi:hypothetical protein CHU98_g12044 [Xylaria longipes]|nr:hypothetical protein CHU98_g12044 [Xylaria longipes]